MIRIEAEVDNYKWKRKIKNPRLYLQKKINKISNLFHFLKNKSVNISFLLTNSSRMRKLNNKYRKINKITDVLSFPSYNKHDLKKIKSEQVFLGDVVICYEIINSRSKFGNFNLEFDKTWIHGILHLLGYDHVKNKEYKKMSNLEKKFIKII